jgi:GNAT superfamily N-acetyltransferase
MPAVRIVAAGEAELLDMARIAAYAVVEGAGGRYTPEQVLAWSDAVDAASIAGSLTGGRAWLALVGDEPAGFLVLRGDAVHLLYTHPEFTRRGAATALLRTAQSVRRRLLAEASLLSIPVFLRCGFRDGGPVPRTLSGVAFSNRLMVWP